MVIKIQMGFMILLMVILYLKIMVEFIFQRLSHLGKVLKKSLMPLLIFLKHQQNIFLMNYMIQQKPPLLLFKIKIALKLKEPIAHLQDQISL